MKGYELQHRVNVLVVGSIQKDQYGMNKKLQVPEDPSSEAEIVEEAW